MRRIAVVSCALALAAAALGFQDGNCYLLLNETQVNSVKAAAGKTVTITLTRAQIEHLVKYFPNAKVTKMTLTSADIGESGRVDYAPPDDKAAVLLPRSAGK